MPNFHEAKNVFTYDPEKAKALLAEAGAENISIVLTVNNNWVQDLGPQIKNDLDANDSGIQVLLFEELR